jgi:PAS domain-containing protein
MKRKTTQPRKAETAALRQHVEAQQQESHELLNAILNRINDGFVTSDAQMNYTYVNERGGELLGASPQT